MSVRFAEGRIELTGDCPLEDAELLLAALIEYPAAPVDLTGCTGVHTAVVQLLVAANAAIVGAGESGFLQTQLIPALRRAPD